MYEANENKIDWKKIGSRVAIAAGCLLIILGIVGLVSRCSAPNQSEKPKVKEKEDLSAQLDKFEEAILKQLTKETLPVEINSSKTIRLKLLESEQNLKLVDSKNNSCEESGTFAEVTRLEENYALKMNISCGTNKDYRIIYIGCFEECNGSICKGQSGQNGGSCITKSEPKTEELENKNDSTNTNNTNSNTSTSTVNKTTTTTTNKKPNNSTTTSTPSPTQTPTMYEFKKCTTTYSCSTGNLNSENLCETIQNETISKDPYISQVDYINSSRATNSSSVKFKFIEFRNGYYRYIRYQCDDSSYNFSYDTLKCTKSVTSRNTFAPTADTKCDTTWSYSESIDGWTRTGNTK